MMIGPGVNALKAFQPLKEIQAMLRHRISLLCLLLSQGLVCQGAVVFYLDPRTSLNPANPNDLICQPGANGVCGGLFGFRREDLSDRISTLSALGAPPPPAQAGRFVTSGVPRGTKVLGLRTEGDTTIVSFSADIVGKELDEVRLMSIFNQVKATLWQFGVTGSVRVEADGKLLSDYLPPLNRVPPASPMPAGAGQTIPKAFGAGVNTAPNIVTAPLVNALASRKIALSPGHGIFWNGSAWVTQRPVYCSPLNQEDFHTLEMMQYLNTYLTQDGATTKPYRCLDKSLTSPYNSSTPWWEMAANYWTKQLGFPCSVYASSTGDCTLGSGGSEINDDIRARPLAADSDNTDIYVSLHSNGFTGNCTGSCPSGTETYYDSTGLQPAASQSLANFINSALIAALTADVDSTWSCHGVCVKNSNGNYGEIRIPNRPATLTETAFHDTCDRDADANHLRDNFFRSALTWGMYNGICDYFGVAPTYAFYSDELVSNDIPATMTPGQAATVHITFRNRGVLWSDSRGFKLGAVGDSDPFSAATRYTLSSEVGPNTTTTFTLNFTAPAAPGNYTTDWQMVREGVTWFGAILRVNVTVANPSGPPVITTQPQNQTIVQGNTATFTVAAIGNAPLTYQWRKNAVNLSNGGNISGATSATLSVSNVQPGDAGNYSVVVGNTNGSVTSADAALVVTSGLTIGSYTLDTGNMDSTSRNGSYVSYSACSTTAYYSYGIPESGSNCTVFNRDIRWMPALPTYGVTGRGYLTANALVPDTHATATVKFFAVDAAGNDLAGPLTGTINECAYSCTFQTFYTGTPTVTSLGGFRSNTQDDAPPGGGGCGLACGTFPAGYSQMHIQAARWHYINDWVCLGAYGSGSVSDTANRSFAWGESGLYLYPALDTSHGNVIAAGMGLNGKAPGRVTTGDCNNANTLNFDGSTQTNGNADAYGHCDNCDAYGFAWVFSPSGAGPQIMIGTDDGNRLWVNGALKNDNNASRGLIRDQDNTGAVTLGATWNRVLFKIHNFTGGFQGTVSLRNGGNTNLNEPSVNVFDLGGYYSYGVGYEQDTWYPRIDVSSFYGGANPQPGANFYGNNTTVTASGTASVAGPVPLWKTMHYEWGYGISGDSNYADVSGTPTNSAWSHTATGVTGHRRFHFFSVSQSGRTSFQTNGLTGGAGFADGGQANYMDIFIDNQPPQNPGFSSVTPAGTTQINLAWALPLDQGVGIAVGAAEAADETSNASGNYYRVGDVGVQVYRNGTPVSTWSTATSVNDTGLAANTSYAYTIEARDNNSGARGAWNNATGPQSSTIAWTLSIAPTAGSITPSTAIPIVNHGVTWTAVNGFGAGQVQYYRYAFDTSPAHTFDDTETQWSSGTIATTPDAAGNWYLHVKGYNGADVGNGTADYAITAVPAVSATALLSSQNPAVYGQSVSFTATVSGTNGTPTGIVTFKDGATVLATRDLNVSAQATLTTNGLSVSGSPHSMTAIYEGDGQYGTSTSSIVSQVITQTCSQTDAVGGITDNQDGTFTLTFIGTPQAQYYVVTTPDLTEPVAWTPLAGSTNTAASGTGLWSVTVPNGEPQRFYRSAAVAPCP
jgi:hypothetical protein